VLSQVRAGFTTQASETRRRHAGGGRQPQSPENRNAHSLISLGVPIGFVPSLPQGGKVISVEKILLPTDLLERETVNRDIPAAILGPRLEKMATSA